MRAAGWILPSVKTAETRLLESQATKAYLGTAGAPEFNAAIQDLTFGSAVSDDRLVTIQTPGGSGSLRVAAGILLRAQASVSVWVSEPTWANHVPLLGGAGLDVFEDEPRIPEALKSMEQVVLTPHVGSATVETRRAMGGARCGSTKATQQPRKPAPLNRAP